MAEAFPFSTETDLPLIHPKLVRDQARRTCASGTRKEPTMTELVRVQARGTYAPGTHYGPILLMEMDGMQWTQ